MSDSRLFNDSNHLKEQNESYKNRLSEEQARYQELEDSCRTARTTIAVCQGENKQLTQVFNNFKVSHEKLMAEWRTKYTTLQNTYTAHRQYAMMMIGCAACLILLLMFALMRKGSGEVDPYGY